MGRSLQLDMREEEENLEAFGLSEDIEVEEELEELARATQLEQGSFYENLASRIADTLQMGEQYLARLGDDILTHMENDREGRRTWEDQLKTGLELLGTSFRGPDGGMEISALKKPFDENPSNAFSNAKLETLVSFVSTAERELLPPGKCLHVLSTVEPTDEIIDRDERVETYTNDLLRDKCPDFRAELPRTWLWAGEAGESYLKTTWDRIKNKPIFQAVSPLDLILPPNCSDIGTASRIIHRYKISEREMKLRQESGFYRDIKVMPYTGESFLQEDNRIEEDMDGFDSSSFQPESLNPTYEIVEAHIELRLHAGMEQWSTLPSQGIPLPYIVHISPVSRKILAIYRNWEESDATAQRLDWFSAFVFFPGFFGRGYGLAQLAGENALTSTIILRDILNLNTLNIRPSGVRQPGLRVANNQIRFNAGEFAQLETGGVPVQQAFEQFKFAQPNPIMMELKKELEEGIRKVGGAIMSTPENVPSQVGQLALLAMMEQNTQTQATVLQRFHRSLSHVYKILFRLLRQYIPLEGLPMENETDISISAYDFQEDMSLVPISDPNLNSKLQRLMRAEAVLNLAQQKPELHNFYEIYKMIYRDLPVEHMDKILIAPEEVKPLDPLTENMNLMQGKAAKAGMDQDHQSHITVHQLAAQDPNGDPSVQSAVKAHIQEHQAMQMAVQLQSMSGVQLPPPDKTKELPTQIQNEIAVHLAQAAQQMLDQQQQAAAAQQPPNPTEVMMQEMEFRKIAQEQKNKIDQLNIQFKILESLMKDQKDKYESAIKFYKETGSNPPSYEEVLGESQLSTGDALNLAGQLSAQADQGLEEIQQKSQQGQQQVQQSQQGQQPQGEGQPGEEAYNPPPLPGEEQQGQQQPEQQEQQGQQQQGQ